LIGPLLEAMESAGVGPYQADHDVANGQFEVNWTFSDAVTTADRHTLFKVMVKSMAEAQGLRASLTPKPFAELTGNGCHTHLSLQGAPGTSRAGENLFHDPVGKRGLPDGAADHDVTTTTTTRRRWQQAHARFCQPIWVRCWWLLPPLPGCAVAWAKPFAVPMSAC